MARPLLAARRAAAQRLQPCLPAELREGPDASKLWKLTNISQIVLLPSRTGMKITKEEYPTKNLVHGIRNSASIEETIVER